MEQDVPENTKKPSSLSEEVAELLMDDFDKRHPAALRAAVEYVDSPEPEEVEIDDTIQEESDDPDDESLPQEFSLTLQEEAEPASRPKKAKKKLIELLEETTSYNEEEDSFPGLDEEYPPSQNAIDVAKLMAENYQLPEEKEPEIEYVEPVIEKMSLEMAAESVIEGMMQKQEKKQEKKASTIVWPVRKPTSIYPVEGNVLEKICASKRDHIKRQQAIIVEGKLREKISGMPPTRGFIAAINKKISAGKNALIAEVKKASPSKGVIRENFDPAAIAGAYEKGGATCVSVLTDRPYFQGRDEYINIVRRECKLPILRKDFMLDPYQVVEARALGADCILLIMAALSDDIAMELENEAVALGMDVLIEVHDEKELERALKLKSMMIGINNRNLKTMKVDLAVTEKLAPLIPSPRTVVCESGIYTHEDIIRMNENARTRAFLVGETLMKQEDIEAATRKLLNI